MTAAQARMWDQRYAGEDYAYGLEPNAFLAAQSGLWAPGMRALVPGDGAGRNGVFLAAEGLIVETLDLSEHGVAKTLRLAAAKNVSVEARQADALTWDWPQNAYDLIALVFLHLVEPERKLVHARALAALKPGGHIVLEAFRPEQIERHGQGTRGGPRDAQLLYTLDDLSDDFAAAEIVELAAADVDQSEGLLHRGPSATVRLVARKR